MSESPVVETAPTGAALVDDVAEKIRQRIMSGAIPIGAQLRQSDLATDFGVSRTPIREALRQLQSGGLIEVLPNRGAVVRVPSPWEVREAYEVRAELEALAAARAVSRLSKAQIAELTRNNEEMYALSQGQEQGTESPELSHRRSNDMFHTLIADASGNSRLAKVINDLNETFPRNVSAQLIVTNDRHRDENHDEHCRIIAALAAGDEQAAAEEMRQHVRKAGEQLARWYERRSETVFRG